MSEELLRVLKRLAELRGTSLDHEVAKYNVELVERHRANGKPLPCPNEEERLARQKAARKRGG